MLLLLLLIIKKPQMRGLFGKYLVYLNLGIIGCEMLLNLRPCVCALV